MTNHDTQKRRTLKNSISITYVDLINPEEPDIRNIDVINSLIKIAKKPLEIRTAQQINYFYNALTYLKYIKRLLEYADKEAVKSLVKASKVIRFTQNTLLFPPQSKNQHFFILIKGKVQITSIINKEADRQAAQNLFFGMIYEVVQPQKKSKHSKQKVQNKQQKSLHRILSEQEVFGEQVQKMFHRRDYEVRALQQSYLVQIPLDIYVTILKQYNIRRSLEMKTIYRKFRCFDMLEDKELMRVIKQSQQIRKTKRNFIYRQGQKKPQCIYILKKGEVQITKKCQIEDDLFFNERTPSDLYSSPEKKPPIMIISILNNENMFGQEDINNSCWQTSAKVLSSQAVFDLICLQKLQVVLKTQNLTLQFFKNYLNIKCQKKLNYRKNRFSQVLEIKRMSSFKIQKTDQKQNSTEKQKESSRNLSFSRVKSQIKCNTQRATSRFEIKQMRDTVYSKALMLTKSKIVVQRDIKTASSSKARRLKSASPQRNQISFANPLFDLHYFRDFQRENKKRKKDQQRKLLNLLLISSKSKTKRVHL